MKRLATFLALALVVTEAAAQSKTAPRDRTLNIQASGKPSEARHALVIGNGNYAVGPLRNPVNDARAMAKALGAAGFNVRVVEDATQAGMQRAVRQWGDDIAKGGVGLFYYAGHGLQVRGRNFLVPVNADIDREDEVEFNTVDVNQVLAKMDSAKNMLNIVILDACRNNPFARSFRSASRGLAQMDAPTGTFIAFATAPGSVASDGAGENGLYTQHLLHEMQRPGLPIEQMFKQVRNNVMRDTKDQQIPWESSSMRGDFAFRPGAAVAAVAAPVAVAAPAASAAPSVSLADMERMIQAALDKQRAMLEAQGVKVQQAPPPPPKPAGPDPREKEMKAAAEKVAAERAAAERILAEAKEASRKASEERLAAQKAAAQLAVAEKAASERAAAAKLASERAAAEQAAARLASERAAADRVAAQKAAVEMNAAADRATAERAAAEKGRAERVQVALAAPVSVAAASDSGRLPKPGNTWTYRLTEPNRTNGPKQRTYVATVQAASEAGILEQFKVDGSPEAQWVHGADAYLANLGPSVFSPYLDSFRELQPKASLGGVTMNEPSCLSAFQCDATARVVGPETIKVPAGTFDAIKVRVVQQWRPSNSTGWAAMRMQGGREMFVWYVPQLKRAAKFQSRLTVGEVTPMETDFDLELVSYELSGKPPSANFMAASTAVASAAPTPVRTASTARLVQGETWSYRLTEPKRTTGPKQRGYTATIETASDASVIERIRIDGEMETRATHGESLSLVNSGMSLLSPYLAAFRDLAPGTPLGSVQMNDPACSGAFACEVSAKVIGRESIKVPAGTFNAIKVRVDHNWRPANPSGRGDSQYMGGRELTVWYVAELKRAVKFSSRLNVGDYPPVESNFDLELVSYQLK